MPILVMIGVAEDVDYITALVFCQISQAPSYHLAAKK
jgi:hypothetical protein